MKLLVVFGSESDKPYYNPIYETLSANHDVTLEVISAHRHHQKLQQHLKDNTYDLILAGAGIAAHLPGVIASLVPTPVLGLAVPSQYRGLDSFASILQMPYGVPVATTMADHTTQIKQFIEKIAMTKISDFKSINIVLREQSDWMKKELDRTKALLTDLGFDFTVSTEMRHESVNIALHTNDSTLNIAEEVMCNIPLINDTDIKSEKTLLKVFNWAQQGGIWFGTNNTRNAILYTTKLARLKENLHFKETYKIDRVGSSKDIISKKGDNQHLYMGFTDRYSAFDWGEMPNKIPNKGFSQANFSFNLYNFLGDPQAAWCNEAFLTFLKPHLNKLDETTLEKLQRTGVSHHAKEFILHQNKPMIKVKSYNVIFPEFKDGHYDYKPFESNPEDTVVPLEVIFRFGVPKGSSVLKRASDKVYCDAAGIPSDLQEGQRFASPLIEFSTKFEAKDSFIYPEVAQKIAGMTIHEFETLKSLSKLIALQLQFMFNKMGIDLWDGKLEFGFGKTIEGDREIVLVDTLGADEMRLTKNGERLSKEVLRQYYTDSAWKAAIQKAQDIAQAEKTDDWKNICINRLHATPHKLDDEKVEQVAQIYEALDEAFTNFLASIAKEEKVS